MTQLARIRHWCRLTITDRAENLKTCTIGDFNKIFSLSRPRRQNFPNFVLNSKLSRNFCHINHVYIFNYPGTLIEAAKVGNVSKMLGRSKSEDSVCNSSNNSSPVHGQVRVTYSQNCGQHYQETGTSNEQNVNNNIKDHHHLHHGGGSHFFHTTTGKRNTPISAVF